MTACQSNVSTEVAKWEKDHARNLLHEVVNIYLQLQLFNVGFSLYWDGNSLTSLLEGDQIS